MTREKTSLFCAKYRIFQGVLLIAFHDSVTQQNASKRNKACTYRDLQTRPQFLQLLEVMLDYLQYFQEPMAVPDLRSNIWDCVSSKVMEPGNSAATWHRMAGKKTNSLNRLPAWNPVSGLHDFLFPMRKPHSPQMVSARTFLQWLFRMKHVLVVKQKCIQEL